MSSSSCVCWVCLLLGFFFKICSINVQRSSRSVRSPLSPLSTCFLSSPARRLLRTAVQNATAAWRKSFHLLFLQSGVRGERDRWVDGKRRLHAVHGLGFSTEAMQLPSEADAFRFSLLMLIRGHGLTAHAVMQFLPCATPPPRSPSGALLACSQPPLGFFFFFWPRSFSTSLPSRLPNDGVTFPPRPGERRHWRLQPRTHLLAKHFAPGLHSLPPLRLPACALVRLR